MADMSILENSGYTTLHQTVLANNLEATNALLSLGVNPDILDNHGLAPLHYVAMNDNVEIAKVLLDNNADINIRSEQCDDPTCREAMRCIRLEGVRG
jgi:ankyrin repeat protein